jgi:hypothetical protein
MRKHKYGPLIPVDPTYWQYYLLEGNGYANDKTSESIPSLDVQGSSQNGLTYALQRFKV